MLVEVISVCSLAQEELAKQVDEIASLRNQVASAGAKLDELTRRSIVLRTRLVAAQETFVDVKSRYAPEALASIDDNVEMATVALEQADRQLDIGRAQEAKPAGQQGGVINALREVERALDLADRLLLGVEHADNNIAAAHDGLEPLMEEVRGEIREAEQLKERGAREGTPADWDALDETVAEATALLVKARVQEETDPLGVYTELLDIDGRLDEHLDTVRASTAVRGRQLSLLDKQMESARVQIQVADDLISSRGVVVQAQARTHLATAKELALQAMNFRITNTREAADYALRAAHQAKWASDKAQEDIRAHQKQMDELEANRSKEIAAGMVAAQLLAEAGKTNQAGPPAGLSDQERRKREREETRKGKWARWISSIDDSSSSSFSSSSSSSGSSSRGGSAGSGSSSSSRSSTSSRNDSGGGSSSRGGSF